MGRGSVGCVVKCAVGLVSDARRAYLRGHVFKNARVFTNVRGEVAGVSDAENLLLTNTSKRDIIKMNNIYNQKGRHRWILIQIAKSVSALLRRCKRVGRGFTATMSQRTVPCDNISNEVAEWLGKHNWPTSIKLLP